MQRCIPTKIRVLNFRTRFDKFHDRVWGTFLSFEFQKEYFINS